MEMKEILKQKTKLCRQAKGLTQEKVAELTGIETSYYSAIENGYKIPSVKVLTKLINVLGFSLDDLLIDSKKSSTEYLIIDLLQKCNENELEIILATVNSIIKNRK